MAILGEGNFPALHGCCRWFGFSKSFGNGRVTKMVRAPHLSRFEGSTAEGAAWRGFGSLAFVFSVFEDMAARDRPSWAYHSGRRRAVFFFICRLSKASFIEAENKRAVL